MPIDTTTHYTTLGIAETATQDDIKKAYKDLELQYHQDQNSDKANDFEAITEAYTTLSDPVSREEYDDIKKYLKFHREFNQAVERLPKNEKDSILSNPLPKPGDVNAYTATAIEFSILALDKVEGKGHSPISKWQKVSDRLEKVLIYHPVSKLIHLEEVLVNFLHKELEQTGHVSTHPSNHGNYTIREVELEVIAKKVGHTINYIDKCSAEELPKVVAAMMVIDNYHSLKVNYTVAPKGKEGILMKLEEAGSEFARNTTSTTAISAYAAAIKELFTNKGGISNRPEKFLTLEDGTEIIRPKMVTSPIKNSPIKNLDSHYEPLKKALTDLEIINHPHLTGNQR